jgi:SET domain-containing protein
MAPLSASIATEARALVVPPIPGRGRGVFAARPFEAGEVLELAPVSVIGAREAELLEQTPLAHHYFHRDGDESNELGWRGAIAYGLASLVNHAEVASAGVWPDHERQVLVLEALRPIVAGEEITIHYDVELWCEAV